MGKKATLLSRDVLQNILNEATTIEAEISEADKQIETLKEQLKVAREAREELVADLRLTVRRKAQPLLVDQPDAGK